MFEHTSVKSKIEWSVLEEIDQLPAIEEKGEKQFLKCEQKLSKQDFRRKSIVSSENKSKFKGK